MDKILHVEGVLLWIQLHCEYPTQIEEKEAQMTSSVKGREYLLRIVEDDLR